MEDSWCQATLGLGRRVLPCQHIAERKHLITFWTAMDMMRCSLVSLSVMILQWRDLESCFLCLDLVIILGLLLSLVFKKRNSRLPSPISGMGIWVTTKAEPNELLWSTSLKLIWKLFPVLIVFKLAVSSLMKRRNGLFFFLMAVLPIPSPRGILQRSLHHWREWLL